jgi:hypothetical protein
MWKKLICKLFGHNWMKGGNASTYGCCRCGKVITSYQVLFGIPETKGIIKDE